MVTRTAQYQCVEAIVGFGKEASLVDLDRADTADGFTALHAAAYHGAGQAVSSLLVAGADPRLSDLHGKTARESCLSGSIIQPDIPAILILTLLA